MAHSLRRHATPIRSARLDAINIQGMGTEGLSEGVTEGHVREYDAGRASTGIVPSVLGFGMRRMSGTLKPTERLHG